MISQIFSDVEGEWIETSTIKAVHFVKQYVNFADRNAYLPAGLSRECRVRRRCDVLLGHRRRWRTHATACVGPAQAARARYLPGSMPGRALQRWLCIHWTTPLHFLYSIHHTPSSLSHTNRHTLFTYNARILCTVECRVIWNKRCIQSTIKQCWVI